MPQTIDITKLRAKLQGSQTTQDYADIWKQPAEVPSEPILTTAEQATPKEAAGTAPKAGRREAKCEPAVPAEAAPVVAARPEAAAPVPSATGKVIDISKVRKKLKGSQ